MKYLSDYTEQGINALLEKYEAFFAFGNSQFEARKKEGVIYVHISSGLLCPKEHAEKLVDGLEENFENAIKQDINENGKYNIIARELANHEAFYVGSIKDTCEAVECYGYTENDVLEVYNLEIKKQQNESIN